MSTPAAAVLDGSGAGASAGSGAGSAAGSAAGVASGAGGAGAGPAGGSAANQPFFQSWDKPDQKDVRDWVANKNYADPFVLAKSARELESNLNTLRTQANLKGYPADTINPDGTVTPANADQRKAWNLTMGVPETADKYDLPVPADNPFPEYKTMMAEEFHKAGVPAAMATAIAKANEAATQKMLANIKDRENTQSKSALLELERDWGANYQERTALATRGKEWLSKQVGGLTNEQMRTMETTLGTAKFISAMWKIGEGNKEAGFAGGNGSPSTFGNSADSAQKELNQIQADRSAGKISNFQWHEIAKSGGRLEQLTNVIANGMAPKQ